MGIWAHWSRECRRSVVVVVCVALLHDLLALVFPAKAFFFPFVLSQLVSLIAVLISSNLELFTVSIIMAGRGKSRTEI